MRLIILCVWSKVSAVRPNKRILLEACTQVYGILRKNDVVYTRLEPDTSPSPITRMQRLLLMNFKCHLYIDYEIVALKPPPPLFSIYLRGWKEG